MGEFFEVSGSGDDVRVEGDLSRVRYVGAGMTAGRLTVAGDVGAHAGAGMRGGELQVEGDAGDHAGAGMHGGTLVVRGSAGRSSAASACVVARSSSTATRARRPAPACGAG